MPSTVIKYFRYDEVTRILTIHFLSGALYQYADVPPEVVEHFKNAFSKGQFFANHIRDIYAYKRVIFNPA